jgi:hypothetical protein
LATEPTPQRSYRAACPHCGAPVDFRSAASAFAICSYCKSQIVREGEALRRIGEVAELFDDHSPLQLGAGGRYDGVAFTLVGRLQYRYKDGTWNEWHALFDNGRSGWLSEDNGRYVIAFDAPVPKDVPRQEVLQPGERRLLDGIAWSVASVQVVRLISAQGELPHPPQLQRGFVVADLRNPQQDVGTLDYSDPAAPHWSVGRSVALSSLSMTGLSESSEKTLSARGVSCPSCGAALSIKLENSLSVVCGQCHAVVDLSQGVGGDLKHYAQDNGSEPQIPLGSIGRLAIGDTAVLAWQVVGYAERCEIGDEEQTFWREYLLYHRKAGFAFLVDTDDGWSWVVPITGAPEERAASARYMGMNFTKLYDYASKVTYALGEFYWKVQRDQLTRHTDYHGGGSHDNKRLNREQTENEVTWSIGETLDASHVQRAFNLSAGSAAALKRDASPTFSSGPPTWLAKVALVMAVLIVLVIVERCEDADDCNYLRQTYGETSQEYKNCRSNSYRSGGGSSYGGFSSGGSHK